MQIGLVTDKGLKREINQDYYGMIEENENIPYVFIIADGMGGHKAGEVASRLSVEFSLSHIRKTLNKKMSKEEIVSKLQDIVKQVNSEVYKESLENQDNEGMGTTLIITVVMPCYVIIAHVGDSRVYVFREQELKKITNDHSYVEELVKNGTITREEAKKNPNKNVLTRAVGYSEKVETDIYTYDRKEKDIFMMCTDGLTNMVDESTIKKVFLEKDKPQDIVQSLIDKSNENGGLDNITIIVFKDDEVIN